MRCRRIGAIPDASDHGTTSSRSDTGPGQVAQLEDRVDRPVEHVDEVAHAALAARLPADRGERDAARRARRRDDARELDQRRGARELRRRAAAGRVTGGDDDELRPRRAARLLGEDRHELAVAVGRGAR